MKELDDYIDQDELNFVDDAAIRIMQTILTTVKDLKNVDAEEREVMSITAFETAHQMLKVRRLYVQENANLEDEG
jgi:hypothetical protein